MKSLSLVVLFAMTRSLYSAAIEAFVTWGLVELLVPAINKSYGYHFSFWFLAGFIISCIRFRKLFND